MTVVMSVVVTDEAVEAVARVLYARNGAKTWEEISPVVRRSWLARAREVLEAALPYLRVPAA